MTSEQKKTSNMLTADGFHLIEGGVGAVLHMVEGEICAAIDDNGCIDLVRPVGRGMIPIEVDEVPLRFMEVMSRRAEGRRDLRLMLGIRKPTTR
jgi:hypothetical protein